MTDENKLDIKVYLGPRDPSALKKAIEYCKAKADFAILESLTKTDFPDPKIQEIDPQQYPKGHVFSKAFELRWEKMEDKNGYRTVLASETETVWNGDQFAEYFKDDHTVETELSNDLCGTIEEYTVYLRPENDPSLGRALSYDCIKQRPKKDKPNALLDIKRYHDGRGRLLFWRYCKMRWE